MLRRAGVRRTRAIPEVQLTVTQTTIRGRRACASRR
jgi:hypothetical protein